MSEACAGLYAAFATESRLPRANGPVAESDAIGHAVASGDEHAIKFAEAALRAAPQAAAPAATIDRVATILSEGDR